MNKKIILLPLDDRPCNALYPHHIGLPNHLLVSPPKEILGYKKQPGNYDALKKWLSEAVKSASHLVISIDQLVYGGLIPSRLHYFGQGELLARLSLIHDLKRENPQLTIFAFVMIMRNPFYNSSDEEPDYYEYDGSNIYKSGYYPHKKELNGELTSEEDADYKQAISALNQDNLKDYLERRATNIDIVKATIDLHINGFIDYLVIPQDDSSPFGYTKRDQNRVRAYITSKGAKDIDIYPGADEVGLVLIARAVQHMYGKCSEFEIIFASYLGQFEIPPFEDRPLIESVTSQINASGSEYSNSPEAIKLYINVASKFVDPHDELYHQSFFVERDLNAFVEQIEASIINGDKVALADVAFANGGEKELVKLLDQHDLALKLYAYGGWNTSSNTLGTVIAQAIIYETFHLTEKNRYFLLHRFYEDVGYMNYVRGFTVNHLLEPLGYNYFNAGSIRGEVSHLVAQHLMTYMLDEFPNIAQHVFNVDVAHPWERMFEIDLQLNLANATKVAVDIGGTYIKAGRVKQGVIQTLVKNPTKGNLGREVIFENLCFVIDQLLDDEVTGIAISTAGDIDPLEGKCTYASDNLKGWTGFNIKEAIEAKYHRLTYVENDAYCHLNAEIRNYPNIKNVTLITLGTGVGGASLIDGKLDRTPKTKWGYRVIVHGGRPLPGASDGVSEAYLALRNLHKALGPKKESNVIEKLFNDYLDGNPKAKKIINNYAVYLNLLLNLINKEVNPELIILGGGLVTNQAVIKQIVDAKINNYTFAKQGNEAGIIGAYYLPIKEK